MPRRYWLFKSEPATFSIADLEACPDGVSGWEGVRNYQARNMLRDDIKAGDEVLFYHSNARPSGIAGLCRVVKAAIPTIPPATPKANITTPKPPGKTLSGTWSMLSLSINLKKSFRWRSSKKRRVLKR